MSQSNLNMHDVLAPAFETSGRLNEAIADEKLELDRNAKTRMRKELNRLKGMMEDVLKFKDDVPEDVIEGLEDVIVNTEAKLDGKPLMFKGDIESAEHQQAA